MAGRSGVAQRRHILPMAARTEHSMHLSGASCRYRGNSDGASFWPLPRRCVRACDADGRDHGNVAICCTEGAGRVKHYWIKLFRDERGEELVENCLINALLVGLVCTAIAVSALRVRYAVCTAAVLPV